MVNTPYYSKEDNKVVTPTFYRYLSADSYFHEVFHELSHFAGDERRQERLLKYRLENLEEYAIEELRAEISSSFIYNELGIKSSDNYDYLDNSQDYIQSCLQVIEEDPSALFATIKDAENI